ncbi:MAG: SIS domain-containing protein [Anaerolineales bacterium]|nr:SIS domain-containing protein [Anaerolineales bacterium]
MSLPLAILAGGLATRLRPLTEKIPKSLVEVAGKPFIVHQMELLRRNGVTQLALCLGYLGEQIQAELGDGSRWGMQVDYVFDGPELLGTGGALRRALPRLGEAFFILYGDTYLDCDYEAVENAFRNSGKLGLMTVLHNKNMWDLSNVIFENDRIHLYDKKNHVPEMEHIDYGLGVLKASVLECYPADRMLDLATIYQDLLAQDQLAGYEVSQRFYEIGSPTGLQETRGYILLREHKMSSYTEKHLTEASQIISQLDVGAIEKMVEHLVSLRQRGGRLFFLGVGGSAANCSHAVNDFRKIAGIEAYAPTDNVSELTARTNDEGWASVFVEWLKVSHLNDRDLLFVFSVGGGNVEKNVSPNLVLALQYAKQIGASVVGVLGRDGGYTAQVADACVIVPTVNPETVTPHAEAFQAVVWHLLVSHPALKAAPTKWESMR